MYAVFTKNRPEIGVHSPYSPSSALKCSDSEPALLRWRPLRKTRWSARWNALAAFAQHIHAIHRIDCKSICPLSYAKAGS